MIVPIIQAIQNIFNKRLDNINNFNIKIFSAITNKYEVKEVRKTDYIEYEKTILKNSRNSSIIKFLLRHDLVWQFQNRFIYRRQEYNLRLFYFDDLAHHQNLNEIYF